jgi:hypothetical protein
LEKCKEDVKKTRALLRKYFGVFLTNKILGAGKKSFAGKKENDKIADEILKSHLSTRNRDYLELYERIVGKNKGNGEIIIDLGCGVNGFSYKFIKNSVLRNNNSREIRYVGVEAVKQLVDIMNQYFKDKKFNACVIWQDLFDINKILKIIKNAGTKNKDKEREAEKGKVIWMFNIIDALEVFKRNYSKKLILEIFKLKDIKKIVLSFPSKGLSGRKRFKVSRGWLIGFVCENFKILDDFSIHGERFIVFKSV